MAWKIVYTNGISSGLERTFLVKHLALALALALTAWTPMAAVAADHDHAGHPASGKVAHSHQQVKAGGLTATFHFNSPDKPVYTCVMHPEVTAAKPGKCPKCKMGLTKQTHLLGLSLTDGAKKPVMDAKVHLVVTDAHGMSQQLALTPAGNMHSGAFALMPGKQTLKAHVTRAGKALEVSTTYEVK